MKCFRQMPGKTIFAVALEERSKRNDEQTVTAAAAALSGEVATLTDEGTVSGGATKQRQQKILSRRAWSLLEGGSSEL
jgi:hypothetical protein